MRLNWKDFGRRWQMIWLLAFGTAPVALVLCAHAPDGRWGGGLTMMAIYAVLAGLCLTVPGKRRLAAGAGCAALLTAAGFVLLPVREFPVAALLIVLYGTMLLAGLPIGGWERGRELHPAAGTTCLAAHVAVQVLVNVDARSGEKLYGSVAALLTLCFVGFAALMLLSLNRMNLNEATNGRQTAPASMRRKNVALTMGLLAVTLMIASAPAVIRAARALWAWLKARIAELLRWLAGLLPMDGETGVEGGGLGGMFPGGEAQEPGELAMILQKALTVLVCIGLTVLAAVVLRLLWKKLRRLAAWLRERLGAYAAATSEDYEDEVVDTREDGERSRIVRKRRRKAERLDERRLSPAGRIRYRYRKLCARHPEWTEASTARENLPDSAASIYERARYSGREATAEDAEAFARETKERP